MQARNILDIRKSTIGFTMNGSDSELVLSPTSTLTVLFNTKDGKDAVVEGNAEYVCKFLNRAGVKAALREDI